MPLIQFVSRFNILRCFLFWRGDILRCKSFNVVIGFGIGILQIFGRALSIPYSVCMCVCVKCINQIFSRRSNPKIWKFQWNRTIPEVKTVARILNCCSCCEHDKCLYVLHSIMSIMSTSRKTSNEITMNQWEKNATAAASSASASAATTNTTLPNK